MFPAWLSASLDPFLICLIGKKSDSLPREGLDNKVFRSIVGSVRRLRYHSQYFSHLDTFASDARYIKMAVGGHLSLSASAAGGAVNYQWKQICVDISAGPMKLLA